jgi:hypothetical protein
MQLGGVASSAASTIVGQNFPAPSGSANAADKTKIKNQNENRR